MDSHVPVKRQRPTGNRRSVTRTGTREADSIARELPVSLTQSRLDRISERAYAIYEARGGEHGRSLDDWLEAERQIDAEQR